MKMASTSALKVHPLSGGDSRGLLFLEESRIYRAVDASSVADVRELLEQGILEKLAADGLIPRTVLSKKPIQGYDLVLEHEVIPSVSYAHEWTYSMLQDAALLVLKLRSELVKFGFDLSDAHCDNITFHRGRPLWVDIGSFFRNPTPDVWAAERRFRQSFIYPLKIWRRHGDYIGRRLFAGAEYLPREAMWLACSPWAHWVSRNTLRKLCLLADSFAALQGCSVEQLEEKISRSPRLARFVHVLPGRTRLLAAAGRGRLPFQKSSVDRLARVVRHAGKRGYQTTWQDYHSGVLREVASFERYPRFARVVGILKELGPRTVTDIGANQGALALLLHRELGLERLNCLDIDDGSLDICYLRAREASLPFYHAVLDTMRPFGTLPKLPPEERFRAEALVALAVTHHMVLGQSNSVEYTLQRLAKFTSRWILVEYMPWGLSTTPPASPVPPAYSAQRFDAAFRSLFDVISVEELEPKRILYVGRVRHDTRVSDGE
jgi:hypothetical protein